MRIVAAGHGRFESVLSIEAQSGDAAVAGFELHQHLRKLVVAGRTAHQADVGRLFEDLFAFLLGDAAEHGKRFPLAMFFLELLQAVEHLLFRLIADAAGVVEDQLGFFGGFHLLVALMKQRADDLLRVVGVHLAPEGLDVEGLHSSFIVREALA